MRQYQYTHWSDVTMGVVAPRTTASLFDINVYMQIDDSSAFYDDRVYDEKLSDIILYIIFYIDSSPDHYDVIKRKHFPRYWTLWAEIYRSPVDSPQKGRWPTALMFPLICTWTNGWVNNRDVGDLRRHRTHYDVTLMVYLFRVHWT